MNQTDLRSKTIHLRCVACNREYEPGPRLFCDCGHFIEAHYDLQSVRFHDSDNPYVRYFDLLPIADPVNLLPVEQTTTPCRHAHRLGARLGLENLYLKCENELATGSTKDRMATVVLSRFKELGVKAFATSSTGNSSTSFAYVIRHYPECRVYLFAGEEFVPRHAFCDHDQVVLFGLRDATFVDACTVSYAYGERHGFAPERGFFNLARREGLKLAFFEATEQIPGTIDWYVQAISSAMGVYGVHKGAAELVALGRIERAPRLLCVQQESNMPIVRAFQAGSPVIRPDDIVHHPRGIATAILRGDPSRVYPYVREAVRASGGTMTAVSEREIREFRAMVEEEEGISPCFTASTAVAGLARLVREGGIGRRDTIMLNLTGRDRDSGMPNRVHWLNRTAKGWIPAAPIDGQGPHGATGEGA